MDSIKSLTLRISQIREWRLNQKRIIGVENPITKGRTKKLIKPVGKIMNENPKCHLHICEAFLHTFNMKICTHKTCLEVDLLCSCSLTSKVVQCNTMKFIKNLMRYVHLEDTKTLWENRNSPWWNVKGHYVDVHSMSRLMVEPLLFHSS